MEDSVELLTGWVQKRAGAGTMVRHRCVNGPLRTALASY